MKIAIIGAGGVASYLMPALERTFPVDGYLIDADILEKHNLGRQLFSPKQVGMAKSVALIKHTRSKLTAAVDWLTMGSFKENPQWFEDIDLIICLVDNHEARRAAIACATDAPCGIIIGANEYLTSQAIFWHPALEYGCPLERYEEMATSMEGAVGHCNDDEVLESSPQLAIANQVTAALCNFMILRWYGEKGFIDQWKKNGEAEDWFPIEFQTTLGKMETLTLGDIK